MLTVILNRREAPAAWGRDKALLPFCGPTLLQR
jgi:hypothetical protein